MKKIFQQDNLNFVAGVSLHLYIPLDVSVNIIEYVQIIHIYAWQNCWQVEVESSRKAVRLLGASIIDLCTGMLSYIILLMDPDSQFPKVDHIYSVLFLVLMFSLFSLSPLSYSLLSPAYLSALLSLDLLFLILSPLPLILLFSLSLCTTLSLSFYLLSISFSLCLCVFSLCILLSLSLFLSPLHFLLSLSLCFFSLHIALSLSISSPFPSLFVSVFFLSAYRSLSLSISSPFPSLFVYVFFLSAFLPFSLSSLIFWCSLGA